MYLNIAVQHPRSGKIKLVAPAVAYNGQKMPVRLPPPWLSQHTAEVRKPGMWILFILTDPAGAKGAWVY